VSWRLRPRPGGLAHRQLWGRAHPGAGLGGGGGTSGSASAGTLGSDGGSAGDGCVRGQVSADEVLWIGDSWIIDPGTQRSTVKQLALSAGTIAANEEYPSSAAPAASMAQVAEQYHARQRGTPKVKVLLMDGGTWDPIAAQMVGASVSDAIDESIATFEQFLSQVAADGTVQHIVYFLVPELMNIPGVAEMRPRLRQACAASLVPCHFIDLQEVWQQGDPARYTASNGFQASAEGGVAIGQAVWSVMQDNCIAQ
jgi:hypothetical protein